MSDSAFNYTGVGWCIAIGILLILAMAFLVQPVHADEEYEDATLSLPTPEVTSDSSLYISTEIIRIEQGQTVYLNGTYDITGVIGWDLGTDRYLAYCGGYYACDKYTTPVLVKLPPSSRSSKPSLYSYWLDPEIFSGKDGYWYQYDELDEAEHGNTVAFKLVSQYRNLTKTFPNGTVINQSEVIIGNVTQNTVKPTPILPSHPVSDYLLARGDEFTIDDNITEKIWAFGRNTPVYDFETSNGTLEYNASLTQTMEPGEYYFLKQYPGANGEFDVRYMNDQLQWKQGWSGIISESIMGVQPKLVAERVIFAINETDDTYSLMTLEVQEPSVTIEGFTEVPMNPTYTGYQEYRDQPGLVSLFDVRGYTNLRNGTPITVVLDPERRTPSDSKHYTFNTTAVSYDNGNMSCYQVYIPIVWDDMTLGDHTLTAYGPIGQPSYHTFPISILPADSFKPNVTIKYVIDENPWKPNLTIPDPIIIRETIQIVVTVTKEIPVTPRPEVVQKAQDDAVMKLATMVIEAIAVVIVAYTAIRFIYRIIKRQRWYKK